MIPIASSFRDLSGFVFKSDNLYRRAIHESYHNHYQKLMSSGLYDKLISKKLLIPHHEIADATCDKPIIKVIEPEQLHLVSYAYEWSFSMLQDAALCTLNNVLVAIEHGMILKDANTHNIQFYKGKPILIDTLSFEIYDESESWIAYRQFCESFIAPLLLMKYTNASMNKLLLAYPNGIPLPICKSLLPWKAKFNFHNYLHIYLPSKYANKPNKGASQKQAFSKQKLLALLHGLKSYVAGLKLKTDNTVWDNYYSETIISQQYLSIKKELVSNYLKKINFQTLLDLGANDGAFSMLYANSDKQIISLDEDRTCIERLYNICKEKKITNITPLIIDLTTPTPNIGWNLEERDNITQRINSDVTLALALIHHLAIANNIPLQNILSYFHSITNYLIIEFVEKEDEKVKELLRFRKDIFHDYSLGNFKQITNQYFEIIEEQRVGEEHRVMFLLKKK